MGRLLAPALHGVDSTVTVDVGVRVESLATQAAERSWTMSAAVVAVFMGLVALGALGLVVVSWVRRPKAVERTTATAPWQAGIVAIGYVSGEAAERWPSATIVQLACSRVVSIVDERSDRDTDDDELPSNAVKIRFDVAPDDALARSRAGTSGWPLALALFDGHPTLGAEVPAVSNADLARRIRDMTIERFGTAAARYRLGAPVTPVKVATFGGYFAVGGGLLAVAFGAAGTIGLGILAAALGVLALVLRPIVVRRTPLNADGVSLAEDARRSWERFAHRPVTTVADLELALPWAVLYGDWQTVQRLAEVIEQTHSVPSWYRTRGAFSSTRFTSCVTAIGVHLSQPVRRTGPLPWAVDSSSGGTADDGIGAGFDGLGDGAAGDGD